MRIVLFAWLHLPGVCQISEIQIRCLCEGAVQLILRFFPVDSNISSYIIMVN